MRVFLLAILGLLLMAQRADALTHQEITRFAGVSHTTWKAHRAAGAPRPSGRGREAIARWLDSYRQWREANGKVPSEERRKHDEGEPWKARRQQALAMLAFQTLRERQKQLLPRDQVVDQLRRACLTVRHRLNTLVTKCAPLVIACRTVDDAEELLQREVDEILETFRRGLELEPAEEANAVAPS